MQEDLKSSAYSADIIQARFCQETKKNIIVFCANVSCPSKTYMASRRKDDR